MRRSAPICFAWTVKKIFASHCTDRPLDARDRQPCSTLLFFRKTPNEEFMGTPRSPASLSIAQSRQHVRQGAALPFCIRIRERAAGKE